MVSMNSIKLENHVQMRMEPGRIAQFFSQLLSQGVRCGACLECGLKELLCQQIGLPTEYVDQRIQTVFINGSPVDDLDTAVVKPEDAIAMSAAMPGLLGAMLRKGGYYAALRKEITHRSECAASGSGDGFVTIKFFNLTVREVGPLVLEYGIWLKPEELQDLLRSYSDEMQKACSKVSLDGNAIDLNTLPECLASDALIFLQINR